MVQTIFSPRNRDNWVENRETCVPVSALPTPCWVTLRQSLVLSRPPCFPPALLEGWAKPVSTGGLFKVHGSFISLLTYQAHAQRVVIMAGNEDLIMADQFISQQDNAALAHGRARPGLPGEPKRPTAQQRALARYRALSCTSPVG